MKFLKSNFFTLGIILLSFCSLFFFRTVPLKCLWTGYQTLAVSKQADENFVLSTLKSCGCEDVVSLSLQKPCNLSTFGMICQIEKSFQVYEAKKENIFFDKSNSYQIYYIPKKYLKCAEDAYKILSQNYHVNCFMDSKNSFPWIAAIVCCIFSVFLFCFSEKKLFFAVSMIFPILFSFSQPFFANAGAVCLIIFGIFVFQSFRRRKNSLILFFKSILSLLFFVLPVFLIFLTSLRSAFICIICLLASFASERLLYFFETSFDKKSLFSFSLILPAEFVRVKTKSNIKSLLCCIIAIFVILLIFSTSLSFLPISSSNRLFVPIPTRYNKENSIVSLKDYIDYNWYAITYPYRSLNTSVNYDEDIKNGEKIIIPRYTKTENGINKTEEVVFCFDKNFSDSVLEKIDELPNSSMEKMLKEQNILDSVTYAPIGKSDSGYRIFLILLVEFIVPIFCFILFRMRIKKK